MAREMYTAPAHPSSGPVKGSALDRVTVTFVLPHGDDKDWDTRVELTIAKAGVVIAQDTNVAPGQHFSDPGTYGPFAIAVKKQATHEEYTGSITTIKITPNGNDRWITNIIILAHFQDNTVQRSESGTIILDQDVNTFHFAN